jgi:hypothetical protein
VAAIGGGRMRASWHWILAGLSAAAGVGIGGAAWGAEIKAGRAVKEPSPASAWALCRKPTDAPDNNKFPDVPGGDIFGFTDPTDVGSPGECGLAFEYSAAAGKADGRFFAGTLKTEFGVTIAENVALAVAAFTTNHHIHAVTGLDDRNQVRFDGFSGELAYRFIERSARNPVAATFAVEPRWARVDLDGPTGARVTAYAVEFKLFVDSVIVAERLYAALNLTYAPGTQRVHGDPLAGWQRFSDTGASGALTYQVNDRLFLGGEIRHLAAFDGVALDRVAGEALFAGPTLMVKLSETAAFNAVWTPQVWGRAAGSPSRLDLDNFERHQFRLKLAVGF